MLEPAREMMELDGRSATTMQSLRMVLHSEVARRSSTNLIDILMHPRIKR
jgi:hypothetical protein